MTEQVWRHRFVAALVATIRKETGLGESKSFELAFEEVNGFWRDMAQFDSPEAAADLAFQCLKS